MRSPGATAPLVSIDATTGAVAWREDVALPDPRRDEVPLRRPLRVVAVRDGELGIFAAAFADRRIELLLRATPPPAFAGTEPVLVHEADGCFVVRAVGGQYRDRFADAVFVAGRAAPVYAAAEPAPRSSAERVQGLGGGRFVVGRRAPGLTSLRFADGGVGWRRDEACRVVDAGDAGCLVQPGVVSSAWTQLVTDAGEVRWSHKGMALAVRDGCAVVLEYRGDLVRLELATGEVVSRAPLPVHATSGGRQMPERSYDAVDGRFLLELGEDLRAWRA